MLALVPIVVLGATGWHSHGRYEQQTLGLERRIEDRLHELPSHLNGAELPATERAIERGIAVAFEVVRAEIRPYADDRYAWWRLSIERMSRFGGEFWQGVRSALGSEPDTQDTNGSLSRVIDTRDDIKSGLLEGLDDRIAAAVAGADSIMHQELLTEIDAWFNRETVSVSPWLQARYRRMLQPARAHARNAMPPSGHALRRALAWELAEPPVVDVMATDMAFAVLVSDDRDGFEARLTEIIDLMKEEVVSSMTAAVHAARSEAASLLDSPAR